MFIYIFLFVWLAYGILEVIAEKKSKAENHLKLHIITQILWIIIGVLACYQFFIAD